MANFIQKFKEYKIYQRAIFVWVVLLCAIVVFYSLSFMTGLHPLYTYYKDNIKYLETGSPGLAFLFIPGLVEFYSKANSFNNLFLGLALLMVVVCVSLFVFFSHKRRIYYVSNYIVSVAFSVFSTFIGVLLLVNAMSLKKLFDNIDWDRYQQVDADYRVGMPTHGGFDLAWLIFALIVVTALLVILNMVIKMRQKKRIMAEYEQFEKIKKASGN